MSLLYPGRITKLEIGLTALNNVDIDNVILMNWERNHDVRPRLYANLKYPRTYQQPHSWILGSFSTLSDNSFITHLFNFFCYTIIIDRFSITKNTWSIIKQVSNHFLMHSHLFFKFIQLIIKRR